MTVYAADMCELVSVIKILTVLEDCPTKEQRSVVRIFFVVKRAQCDGYT
jgi:hypothetical protein